MQFKLKQTKTTSNW